MQAVRTDLRGVFGVSSELGQFDLGTPVGTVPDEGNVSSAPLLCYVALVVCLRVLRTHILTLKSLESLTWKSPESVNFHMESLIWKVSHMITLKECVGTAPSCRP